MRDFIYLFILTCSCYPVSFFKGKLAESSPFDAQFHTLWTLATFNQHSAMWESYEISHHTGLLNGWYLTPSDVCSNSSRFSSVGLINTNLQSARFSRCSRLWKVRQEMKEGQRKINISGTRCVDSHRSWGHLLRVSHTRHHFIGKYHQVKHENCHVVKWFHQQV